QEDDNIDLTPGYSGRDVRSLPWIEFGCAPDGIGVRTRIERRAPHSPAYCTALIMSKIGRYIATTMPPTTTPRNTIITGSMRLRRLDTAASTSSS
ncbi:MAG: hypothetical protein JWN79_629, partial [Gemmatimonadetes bacterium]|nr:hypothetical protein [Gemmatimonadota bacterium]